MDRSPISKGLTPASEHGECAAATKADFEEAAIFRPVRSSLCFWRKDGLPVVLHTDHDPSVLVGFGHESVRKSTNVGIRKTAAGAVGVLALRVVVVDEHH